MALTIEQYLSGKVDYNVPSEAIAAILADNGVEEGDLLGEIPLEARELCLADLYMWVATSSSQSGTESESDGGWSRTKASKVVTDKAWFRQLARDIYKKWGSDKATLAGGRMTMKDLY